MKILEKILDQEMPALLDLSNDTEEVFVDLTVDN